MPVTFGQRSFDDLGTPLHDVTFCVLDIETTGSDRDHDAITEIGIVKVRGGQHLGTLHTLVDPGRSIPVAISMLTGITQATVSRAPRFGDIAPTIQEFIGDSVIVGHNVGFDLAFINNGLRRTGREPLQGQVVDTLPLARRLVGQDVPDCRLQTLAACLRLDHKPNHRALDDALATTDLLHMLIERAAGWGVVGLDDLIDLPTMAGHPQAAKLRMTDGLPRAPGVYRFHGADGTILYVGKATNLRQRVRSYFGGDERRKVGGLLRETRRISFERTPNVIVAEVLELRSIQQHQPRYNAALTRSASYRYVQLDPGARWPKLTIVNQPRAGCLTLGPLTSASQARLVVSAIEMVLPLRRCNGANDRARTSGQPCVAAQMGRACPCSGTVSNAEYQRVVADAARALTHEPDHVLASLRQRMIELSTQRRFEQAASVRDQAHAFAAAHRRARLSSALVRSGRMQVRVDDVVLHVDHGTLAAVEVDGSLPMPLAVEAPPPPEAHLPIAAEVIDEVLCLARNLERRAPAAALLHVGGQWSCDIHQISEITDLRELAA